VTYTNKIESTPIIGGGCYRLKTVCAAATITLKARIPFNERLTYLQLIKKLASGKIDNLAIASIGFSDMTLLSGKLTDEENSPFMICEITLTEVSE
jgi:hypothetical protein